MNYDLLTARSGSYRFVTQVILDAPASMGSVGNEVFRKLAKDEFVGFPHDVRENVEPSSMSHPHDDFLDPFVRALLKDRIQSRNQGLPAFQRKTLLTDVAGVQKVFKLFGLNDFSQDSQLFIVRKGGLVFIGLDTGLNPTPFFGRLNMKVLDTNVPAIGSFQSFENFPNRHSNPAKIISGKMDFRQVGRLEPKPLQA